MSALYVDYILKLIETTFEIKKHFVARLREIIDNVLHIYGLQIIYYIKSIVHSRFSDIQVGVINFYHSYFSLTL